MGSGDGNHVGDVKVGKMVEFLPRDLGFYELKHFDSLLVSQLVLRVAKVVKFAHELEEE